MVKVFKQTMTKYTSQNHCSSTLVYEWADATNAKIKDIGACFLLKKGLTSTLKNKGTRT